MPRKPIPINRNKLRAAVRKLGNDYVFYMLHDAIELLSPAKLYQFAKKYLDLKRLQPEAEPATKPSLLTDVKRFEGFFIPWSIRSGAGTFWLLFAQAGHSICEHVGENM